MADWCLLVIDNKSHLVNLDSKIIEIKNFGNFPSEFLKGKKKGVEFVRGSLRRCEFTAG